MAPAVGLEPTTDRLTADCSTTELRWTMFWRPIPESNQYKRICSPLHKPFCQPAFVNKFLLSDFIKYVKKKNKNLEFFFKMLYSQLSN